MSISGSAITCSNQPQCFYHPQTCLDHFDRGRAALNYHLIHLPFLATSGFVSYHHIRDCLHVIHPINVGFIWLGTIRSDRGSTYLSAIQFISMRPPVCLLQAILLRKIKTQSKTRPVLQLHLDQNNHHPRFSSCETFHNTCGPSMTPSRKIVCSLL